MLFLLQWYTDLFRVQLITACAMMRLCICRVLKNLTVMCACIQLSDIFVIHNLYSRTVSTKLK